MSASWLDEQKLKAASKPHLHIRYDESEMGWVHVSSPADQTKMMLQSLPSAQEYEERIESERTIRELQRQLKIETDVVVVRHEVAEQMQRGAAWGMEHKIFLRRNMYESSASNRIMSELKKKGWKVEEEVTSLLEWTITRDPKRIS
jgi:hypothetical protein